MEGTVVGFDVISGFPMVLLSNDETMEVTPAPRSVSIVQRDWPMAKRLQIPLTLDWAITLHKALGLNLNAAAVQISDAFEPGMDCVAMSRVNSAQGLRILDDLFSCYECERVRCSASMALGHPFGYSAPW